MTLIFVYNAHSGAANAFLDSLRKIADPAGSSCRLCALTHGLMGEKSRWKRFKRSLEVETSFLHRDEFKRKYRSKWLPDYEFPIVLAAREGVLEIVIHAREIAELKDVGELIDLIRDRLDRY